MRIAYAFLLLPVSLHLLACATEEDLAADLPPVDPCAVTIATGDPVGHADPFGAKAAGQARAGRLDDVSGLPQPAHGRQRIDDGDYVLVNDRLAVTIEGVGKSDGYGTFGGEIVAVDQVGEDGKPAGKSTYLETLVGVGAELIDATSVSVMADGSDGNAAVVRATGPLAVIPFLADSPLTAILPTDFELDAAIDYVLEPGSDRVLLRLSIANTTTKPMDFGVQKDGSDEIYGFFHYSQNQFVTAETGFSEPSGSFDWVGFVGQWPFAWRLVGDPVEYGYYTEGFQLFFGPGFEADACGVSTFDHAEVIAGGPHYDGLREAIRRVDGDAPWRAITGTVADANGSPVAKAWIHELDANGDYASRTQSAADGTFTIHAPPNEAVHLVPQKRGYPSHDGSEVGPADDTLALAFAPHGSIAVTATDLAAGEPLPVRVQVIPTDSPPSTPDSYGVLDERNGRLHQHFAHTGSVTLVVPPGEHRVVVSRGYEWELHDTNVQVVAGETTTIDAVLEHSVDSTGVMCADFHIHSFMSADSNDPVEYKVRGAVADGLDIPVSSEHDWVVDFGPVVEQLGLSQWAFGMASEELTTFQYGHFGVVPIVPRADAYNNGAIDWTGKSPSEVFAEVHALPESPAIIVNHPRSQSFGGYFSAMGFDVDTAAGTDDRYSDAFDALEIFNGSDFESNRDESVADWFALLDHGRKIAAVGSSDSHHLRSSPVGYPRTCLWFGHDDPGQLTDDDVRDAMTSGQSVVGGGMLMTVLGPDGERPGQTIAASGDTVELVVTIDAPSWVSGDTLETIVNGETVGKEPLLPLGEGTSNRHVHQIVVDFDGTQPTWVVFHAKGLADLAPLHPGDRPFAVSNPIFIQ